jgi:alpha-beta hydrolase superfamily lysophospholipase
LFAVVLLAGCVSNTNFIETRDGKDIAYEYHEAGWKGVILVHQLDGSMEDWEPLEKALDTAGISYIAIDLRGHGKSEGNWELFGDEDFRNMTYDVEAAHNYLKLRGVNTVAVIGASIGANVAFKYALWKGMDRLVLLSPGFNYRNVDISDEIGNFTGTALVVASKDDSYSYSTGQVFGRDTNSTFVEVRGNYHGAELLPYVKSRIIGFIS